MVVSGTASRSQAVQLSNLRVPYEPCCSFVVSCADCGVLRSYPPLGLEQFNRPHGNYWVDCPRLVLRDEAKN